mmetsp:Transcript_17300/g.44147  ORF Transcript_17300/g.44147 Transcript_17300/m.44147 type:complete len:224 (-) Transcript_17300:172-843(-)
MGEKHRVSPRRNELQDPLHETRQHLVVDDDLVDHWKQCIHLIFKILGNRPRQLLEPLAKPLDIFDGLFRWHLKLSFHFHDVRGLRQNLFKFRRAFKQAGTRQLQMRAVFHEQLKRVAGKQAAQHLDPEPREGEDVSEPAEEALGLVMTQHITPREQARAHGFHFRDVLPPRILEQRQKTHPACVFRIVPKQPTLTSPLGKPAHPQLPCGFRRRHSEGSPRRAR